MKISSVTYERLSKQRVDSYENERASCTVEINAGENPEEAMDLAKYEVEKALGLLPSDEEIKQAKRVLKRKLRGKILDKYMPVDFDEDPDDLDFDHFG